MWNLKKLTEEWDSFVDLAPDSIFSVLDSPPFGMFKDSIRGIASNCSHESFSWHKPEDLD